MWGDTVRGNGREERLVRTDLKPLQTLLPPSSHVCIHKTSPLSSLACVNLSPLLPCLCQPLPSPPLLVPNCYTTSCTTAPHKRITTAHQSPPQLPPTTATSTGPTTNPMTAPMHTGALHRRRGTVADLTVARDLLSESLRQQPSSAAGWYQLGLACRGLGHTKEAEQHLRTAVVLAAGSPALPYAECPLLLHV